MRRHIVRLFVTASLLVAAVVASAAPIWERIAPPREVVEGVAPEAVDVRVADGAVVVTLTEPVNVKVVTILGQLVAQQQLDAGVWRLPITARGIYIVKIGSITRRVTI